MSTLTEVHSSGSYAEILDARQNLEDPFMNEMMDEEGSMMILLLGILMPAILYASACIYQNRDGSMKVQIHSGAQNCLSI